jgi:hypothetical protein
MIRRQRPVANSDWHGDAGQCRFARDLEATLTFYIWKKYM